MTKKLLTFLNILFYSREKGLRKELRFWDLWMKTKGLDWPHEFTFRTNKNSSLRPILQDLLKKKKEKNLGILDVGAGPITRIGYTMPNKKLEIIACDPLADEYKRLLSKYNIKAPITSQKVDGEKLTEYFRANQFDLVTAFNCLDHSEDPVKIIHEMISVCKTDGIVFLGHAENEAVEENYKGLHQWNFVLDKNSDVLTIEGFSKTINLFVPGYKITNTKIEKTIYTKIKKK